MALQFPSSASIGQTYQSGSSPIYTYNGSVWTLSAGNVGISMLNAYTASLRQALQTTGSNATMLGNLSVQGTQTALNQSSLQISDKTIRIASGSLTSTQANGAGILIDGANVTMSWDSVNSLFNFGTQISSSKFYGDGSGLTGVTSYTNSDNLAYLNTKGVISGSSQVIGILTSLNTYTGSNDIKWNTLQNVTSSLISATSSYETRGRGIISGSSQLTSSLDSRYLRIGGDSVISGSSQLTSSFDTRYTLSGSVVSGTTPAGTISGSSQLTSSYDGRYVQTGSFNTLTASFNSFTASAQSVTTGSNSFNGTQTITGSLIITTGSFVGSQILANTSSLYLTSGSNMYVQNNGVVEITGSLKVSGSANFNVSVLSVDGRSGDEGGEINLAIPVTNTTLQNRVTTDVFQNRFRVFEGSANAKGVFIDLSKAPDGASGEITWKSSGIVNAGSFVQLDNIKATIPSSGNRALALVTTTGTISGYISAHYQGISGGSAGIAQSISLSTSTNTSIFGWNFGQQGDTSHYILRDDTNNRVYRFVVIIGGSYNNNFISIERLH